MKLLKTGLEATQNINNDLVNITRRTLETGAKEMVESTNSIYDWLMLGFTLACTLPFIIANGALIVWRERRYFQAQGGVFSIVASSFTGLVCIYCSFFNNGHFSFGGTCEVWAFGVSALGISLWFVFTGIRFHRMHRISQDKTRWLRRYNFYIISCIIFNIGFAIILSRINREDRGSCYTKKRLRLVGLFMVYGPYLLISFILLCLFRRETDPLLVTEFERSCEYLGFACFILLLATTATLTEGIESIAARCFLTFCTCCLIFLYFWVRFAYPIYLCLFKPREEMDRFEEELRLSGARALQLGSSNYGQRLYNPSSEGAVLEAFYKASTDVDVYKSVIQKLKDEKELLQNHLRELEMQKLV